MDLVMPGMDGVATTEAILKVSPDSRVLILTTFGSAADIARALKAGATGAVTKNLSNDDLVKAIGLPADKICTRCWTGKDVSDKYWDCASCGKCKGCANPS